MLLPATLAIACLALALLIARHFFPATSVEGEIVRTDILPTVTVLKAKSMVIAPSETDPVVFVATTVRIYNGRRVPAFIDDLKLTFTNSEGAQLVASAEYPKQIPDLELQFPALRPLVHATLDRDTRIEAGQSAEGTLLFALDVPKSMWETRRSAVITVGLYHQNPVILTIPSTAAAQTAPRTSSHP
jgi:hypothetical protein